MNLFNCINSWCCWCHCKKICLLTWILTCFCLWQKLWLGLFYFRSWCSWRNLEIPGFQILPHNINRNLPLYCIHVAFFLGSELVTDKGFNKCYGGNINKKSRQYVYPYCFKWICAVTLCCRVFEIPTPWWYCTINRTPPSPLSTTYCQKPSSYIGGFDRLRLIWIGCYNHRCVTILLIFHLKIQLKIVNFFIWCFWSICVFWW